MFAPGLLHSAHLLLSLSLSCLLPLAASSVFTGLPSVCLVLFCVSSKYCCTAFSTAFSTSLLLRLTSSASSGSAACFSPMRHNRQEKEFIATDRQQPQLYRETLSELGFKSLTASPWLSSSSSSESKVFHKDVYSISDQKYFTAHLYCNTPVKATGYHYEHPLTLEA